MKRNNKYQFSPNILYMKEICINFFDDSKSLIFLLLLLLFDLFFVILFLIHDVALHIENYNGLMNSYRFGLDVEFGFSEIFNYFQISLLCFLLIKIYRKTSGKIYLSWILVYLLVLLDDSLAFHESVGLALSGGVDDPSAPGIRPQDIGELVAFGLMGVVAAITLLIGFIKSPPNHQQVGMLFALIFGVLVFFGFVIDAIGRMVAAGDQLLTTAFTILEDGGEMMSISLACAFAFFINRHFHVIRTENKN